MWWILLILLIGFIGRIFISPYIEEDDDDDISPMDWYDKGR